MLEIRAVLIVMQVNTHSANRPRADIAFLADSTTSKVPHLASHVPSEDHRLKADHFAKTVCREVTPL
jgi:hypothetical protein